MGKGIKDALYNDTREATLSRIEGTVEGSFHIILLITTSLGNSAVFCEANKY